MPSVAICLRTSCASARTATLATAKCCARTLTSAAIRWLAAHTLSASIHPATTRVPAPRALWAIPMMVARMSTNALTPMFADPVPYVRISRAVIAATARRDTMVTVVPNRVASISTNVPARRADAMRIA